MRPSRLIAATSSTRSQPAAEDLGDLRGERGRLGRPPRRRARRRRPRPRRARPPRRRPAAANSTSWVATSTACPSSASAAQDRGQPGLGGVVEPAGRLVEQQHRRRADEHQRRAPAPAAGPRTGRAGGRRRGCRAPAGRGACGIPRAAVGGRALLGDGLEVEQVGGGLRHQPDEVAPARRRQRGRVRPADVDASRPGAGALPCSAQSSVDLPGPVAAHQRGDPARRARRDGRRPRSATVAPWTTVSASRHRATGSSCSGARRRSAAQPRSSPRARRRASRTRQRQRRPAGGPAELDDRGYDGRGGEHLGRARRRARGRRR